MSGTSDHVQQFLDILKEATGGTSNSSPKTDPSKKKEDKTKPIKTSKSKITNIYQLYD